MDRNEIRGRINMILYGIDAARGLGDDSAARLAGKIIDQNDFNGPVERYAQAIKSTLEIGALHPQNREMSRRYSEQELLGFLTRLDRHLDARRPWPAPPFTRLPAEQWSRFTAATPIAEIHQPAYQITERLGESFTEVATAAGEHLLVLVLKLRTGQVVALAGGADSGHPVFGVFQRDPADPVEVIARFREFAGLSPDEMITIRP